MGESVVDSPDEGSLLDAWLGYRFRDWLDAEGRPLGEVGSRLYPSDTATGACPYKGVRHGNPMNLPALRQVKAHWDTNLATIAHLRGQNPNVAAALAAVTTLVAGPIGFREGNALEAIPVAVAALHKANLGYQQTLISLLLDSPGLASSKASELPDGEVLLHALEEGHWLQGTIQACAGAPTDIALAWNVITGRTAPPRTATPLAYPDAGAHIHEILGLEVALVLATMALLERGIRDGLTGFGTPEPDVTSWPLGARLWENQRGPWLIGATTRPGRKPEDVTRLYATVPEPLRKFLDDIPRATSHDALETAFRHRLQSNDPNRTVGSPSRGDGSPGWPHRRSPPRS